MIDRVAAECNSAFSLYKRTAIAVSGGADSVFLLTALHELGLAAAVLHVDHQLRNTESDADAAFVRALAENLNLPFHLATRPPAPGNIEQEARRLRYEFFSACITDGICDAVATGHTMDDQAETVLFRFLRGSGTAGLSGIRPIVSPGIIRPLLTLRRAEIREWLSSRNIPWREDSSNSNLTFQRNRIRAAILPQLAELNPSLPEVLASTAAWARDEEVYWETEIARLEPQYLKTAPETVLVDIGPFVKLPAAVQRRLLRRAIEHVRGDLRAIGFQHVEAIRELMSTQEGSGRIQLPGLDIFRSFDLLRLSPLHFDARIERNFSVLMEVPGEIHLPERSLEIHTELLAPSDVYNGDVNAMDSAKCRGPLLLRNWRPGDQFWWAGHPGAAVRIKTLFQDFRIPLWERRRWPVLVQDDIIVWTRRFGAAVDFRASAASEWVLLIRDAGEDGPGGIKTSPSNV